MKHTRSDLQKIMNHVVQSLCLDVVGHDACIVASRILSHVYQRLGIPSVVSGCKVEAVCETDDDVLMIRVGANGLDGHVIVFVWSEESESWMMADPTVSQLHFVSTDCEPFPYIEPLLLGVGSGDDNMPVRSLSYASHDELGRAVTIDYRFNEPRDPVWCREGYDLTIPIETLICNMQTFREAVRDEGAEAVRKVIQEHLSKEGA